MSDIFDKARDLIAENMDKAKELINENDEKVAGALDKAAEVVDRKTGRKHTDKIAKGSAKTKAAIRNFAEDDKK